MLNAKIKEKRLVDKSDISGFVNNSDLVKNKATRNKSRIKCTLMQI